MTLQEKINKLERKTSSIPSNNMQRVEDGIKHLNIKFDYKHKIHVSGTNGKGSTCMYLSNVLSKFCKTGLFTSPYIINFNERIKINNQSIPNNILDKYLNLVLSDKFFSDYSFFELITLIAFKYFDDEGVDVIIIEVGIGGLLDCTNTINYDISLITNIGHDHMDKLGNSLDSVFKNKIGIVKESNTLVTTIKNYNRQIIEHCQNTNSKYHIISDEDYEIISYSPIIYKFLDNIYKLDMDAEYEIYNPILAIKTLSLLNYDISRSDIKELIKKTFIPARLEKVSTKPLVYIDGGHNLDGVLECFNSIRKLYKNKKIITIFSILKPKDYISVCDIIVKYSENIYYDEFNDPRNYKLKDIIKDYSFIKKYKKNIILENSNYIYLFIGSLHYASYVRKNYFYKK